MHLHQSGDRGLMQRANSRRGEEMGLQGIGRDLVLVRLTHERLLVALSQRPLQRV